MTSLDKIFINLCRKIIDNGESTEGTEVRPRWEDGSPAHTKFITSVVNEYDVGKEFPILTIRPTPITGPFKEICWIFQKKSNNVNDLKLHIWDQWADSDGSICKAYGYQIRKQYVHHKTSDKPKFDAYMESKTKYPSYDVRDSNGEWYHYFDQIDAVLYDLRNNPSSRRIMTNIYNFSDLQDMNLYPCAYSTTWNVFNGKLNLILNQRSNDVLAAFAFNVIEYAMLLTMVAKATGFEVGKMTHVISNCHIYDRHIPLVEEIITRENSTTPIIEFKPKEGKDFYDYDISDWYVKSYEPTMPNIRFPVAI